MKRTSGDGAGSRWPYPSSSALHPSSRQSRLPSTKDVNGSGALTGVSHVQRVATRGGVAPSLPCTSDGLGRREVVQYQADYIFWKPV